MKAYLQRLMGHAAWANDRLLRLLRAAAPPEQQIVRLFSHLLTAERIYLARMRGQDPWPQDFWPELTLDECARLIIDNGSAYHDFFDALTEEDFTALVRYRNSTGIEFRHPVCDLLTHVALHGAYHRGQIAAAVRRSGAEPVNTDFIGFVREAEKVSG